jgi:hypothetical protein
MNNYWKWLTFKVSRHWAWLLSNLLIVPVISSSRSASVLFPWSICAIMQKFLMNLPSNFSKNLRSISFFSIFILCCYILNIQIKSLSNKQNLKVSLLKKILSFEIEKIISDWESFKLILIADISIENINHKWTIKSFVNIFNLIIHTFWF